MSHLYAAIEYASMGFPVFRVSPGDKVPLKGTHGVLDATVDAGQIRQWWTEMPAANIGISTAGLLVVDIDPVKAADGSCSPNLWPHDDDRLADLASPPSSLTPRRGTHHVYRQPAGRDWRISTSALAPFVDVRANGGYICAAPSVTSDGIYSWLRPLCRPEELSEPPDWLTELMDALPTKEPEKKPARNGSTVHHGAISKRWQNALDAETGKVAMAIESTRNDTLNKAAFALGTIVGAGGLERSLVEDRLADAAARCGLPANEAARTIQSGIDAGVKQPRQIPQRNGTPRPSYVQDAPPDAEGLPEPPPIDPEEEAARFEAMEADAPPPDDLESADDPHRLAKLFLADAAHDDGLTVRYWRDEFHRWDGSAYRALADAELRAEISQRIKREFDRLAIVARAKWEKNQKCDDKGKPCPAPVARKVTGRLVADARHALGGLTLLSGLDDAPRWLADPRPFPAPEAIAFKNGILHAKGWIDGRADLLTPSPRFFTQGALDFDFVADARTPQTWLDFLGQLWPNELKAIELLREWFGYCLLSDTSLQKILLLIGPKRSGKGTIARVLRAIVGERNYVSPTLAGLGLNFGLWPLVGKTVAVIADARMSGRTDAQIVAERLLSISGEDAQTIDRKFLPPVTCKLPVRFTIISNELPRLGDSSGALAGRFLILRLTESWYGKEDPHLTSRLLADRQGIMLWALEGLRTLLARGHFIQPDSSDPLIQDLEDLSSPVAAFLRDCCEIGTGFTVERGDLYAEWQTWCKKSGRDKPGDIGGFGKNLRAAFPGLDGAQQRQKDGPRQRLYIGLRIKDGPPPEPSEY